MESMTRNEPPALNLPSRLRFLNDQITEKGRCTRPGVDPDLWFPEFEPSGNAKKQRRFYEQAAAARCWGCPVREQCQEAALTEEGDLLKLGFEPHGIRFGLAPWARANMIRNPASKTASTNIEEAA
ncbi:WhiB family transcriptional regulator [Streptosporangium sp. CA-135522]|uniref:WhiB family transcriptional regulator n=1 Tax=Streptosporangium sp. CA-135522 TaxID=3240072 RepID=UPI003D93C3CD